ncbi:hypothetical protein LB515_19970 [Mesorhizobium sp. CA15]|uniref:hypothetical protein n=1 Tax=unclassified Mesorhizobium TaxID=325217 RepID=UPI001CCC6E0D|nr:MULTISPECIES: hypothetical protein [unclassified Mesorhizobium]MBZ9867657.1 hypothetical protein [Mesorhizobium sp. CA15]MBZ9884403.1 hypothetical protein [Mesorhizobium sp. CA10]
MVRPVGSRGAAIPRLKTAQTFLELLQAPERSNSCKTAVFLKRSFDEKLGVLRPFRFRDVILANGLPESFPQCLELKNRQPLVSFLLFFADVHTALPTA